jgi:acyl-CoA thioesterase I
MLMIGCAEGERNLTPDAPPVAGIPPEAPAGQPPEARRVRPVVLFLGTSLTAGYGLSPEQAFPALVQERIDQAGLPFEAVNAGVSGETSAGALRRIDWILRQHFDILVIETGANDMLRGVDPATTEANIQAIVDRVRQQRGDVRIVLAGMLSMPNLGATYTRQFEPIYPRLAARNDLTLIPFLLEGVAGERHLNLADGIHPNPEGQEIVAATVWETLEAVLREEASRTE